MMITGMMIPRTVFHTAKTNVRGCSRPSSNSVCVRPGAAWAGRGGGTGSGGGSDAIIASNGNQMIAQLHRFICVQARNHDSRFVCPGGVKQQGRQTQGTHEANNEITCRSEEHMTRLQLTCKQF